MRLSVRRDKAYFALSCSDGAEHSAMLTLGGEVISRHNSHNFEEERVIEMLGGEPSNCAKIRNLYDVALIHYKGKFGIADPDNVFTISSDEYWKSDLSCPRCVNYQGNGSTSQRLSHFYSVEHLAYIKQSSEHIAIIRRLVSWFTRNNLYGINPGNALAYDGEFAYVRTSPIFHIANKVSLTPNFISLAEKFVGRNATDIIKLRNVATIQRLQTILEEVGENKIRAIGKKIKRNSAGQKTFATTLIANRVVPTHVLVDFFKAGIHANIYTYSKHYATAHQALRVYNASGGSKTLKEYLEEGISPRDAVRIAEELAINNLMEN